MWKLVLLAVFVAVVLTFVAGAFLSFVFNKDWKIKRFKWFFKILVYTPGLNALCLILVLVGMVIYLLWKHILVEAFKSLINKDKI